MSKYSGRYDLYDSIMMTHKYTEEELKNNVNIYINNIPLKIESYKDLVPYYAHGIAFASHNNIERKSEIHLSSKSLIDREEEELLEMYLTHMVRIFNRYKRKKIEFDIEEAIKEVCFSDWNKDAITELACRVKNNGKKATIDNIHLTSKDYYRQELADEMVRNGINLADYGYERFIKGSEIND